MQAGFIGGMFSWKRLGLAEVGVALAGVASLRGRPRAQQQESKSNRDIFASEELCSWWGKW